MTKLNELAGLGQSVWLDYIRRSFTRQGKLKSLVEQGLRGVTSNPSIFDKAIENSDDYDDDIKRLVRANKSADEIYQALVLEDIRQAARLLVRLYDQTDGRDGYVSLEVNPNLSNDTNRTIAEAKRLFAAAGSANIMIKIPATPAGIPAIEEVIAAGINVNVTLIFSLAQYEAAAGAYIAGLEKLFDAGKPLEKTNSVASFFVSRVDTAVDACLEKTGRSDLQGKAAVDNARLAYVRFREIFTGERWMPLARAGARVQRPLWASTGTKNPAYRDTLYVDSLIGHDTVCTVPPSTLKAFMNDSRIETSIDRDIEGARLRMAELGRLGIDFDAVTQKLLDEGVESFAKSFNSLISNIERKKNDLPAGAECV